MGWGVAYRILLRDGCSCALFGTKTTMAAVGRYHNTETSGKRLFCEGSSVLLMALHFSNANVLRHHPSLHDHTQYLPVRFSKRRPYEISFAYGDPKGYSLHQSKCSIIPCSNFYFEVDVGGVRLLYFCFRADFFGGSNFDARI